MSPVCSQPSGSIVSAVFSRVAAVAEHHHLTAHEHLAVLGERDLDARGGRPDGAELDPLRRVHAAGAAGLRHPPQLRHRDADRVEELEHLDRRGGGADVDGAHLVEAEHLAQAGEDLLVGRGDLGRELRRHLLAALLQANLLNRRSQRALGLCTLLIGLAGDHRLQAGLQLLPDAGHGEEPVGAHLGQVGEHLARVGAGGDLQPVDDRQVVVGAALGDVRGGQPGDHAGLLGELHHRLDPPHGGEQVAVAELHALRRPCGAGGVDQREQVLGPDLRGGLLDGGLRLRIAPEGLDLLEREHAFEERLFVGVVEHDHALEVREVLARLQQPLEVLALDHRDVGVGVGDHILDLVGGVGLVDREGRRAERDRGEVDDVELGAVGEHDRERVAAPETQPVQPPGEVAHALAPLRPGERLLVAFGADRDAVAEPGAGELERLDDRCGVRRRGAPAVGRAPGRAGGGAAHPPNRPMSLLKPFMTRKASSTIPIELKRHIAASETRRPRTFSASDHST